ncbi:MAG: carboxypeptidase regulatory-like domain-containing protein [bacterium]
MIYTLVGVVGIVIFALPAEPAGGTVNVAHFDMGGRVVSYSSILSGGSPNDVIGLQESCYSGTCETGTFIFGARDSDQQFVIRLAGRAMISEIESSQSELSSDREVWDLLEIMTRDGDGDWVSWGRLDGDYNIPRNVSFTRAPSIAVTEILCKYGEYSRDYGGGSRVFEVQAYAEENAFLVEMQVNALSTGVPIAGATVTVFKDGVAIIAGVTDPNGQCVLAPQWYGSDAYYVVRASLGGGRDADCDLGYVNAGDVISRAVAVPAYIEMTGYVHDSCNQRGIAEARVVVFDESDQLVATAYTESDGGFRCDVLFPGSYYFGASKRGTVGSAPDLELYKPAVSPPVMIPSGTYSADLGTLMLETNIVVLVHGIKSGADAWNAAAYPESLRADHWVVPAPVDLPGPLLNWHGFAMIKDQAEFLKAQIDPLGVESVNIIAHSQGGLVSRYLNENLAESGGMVNKLIALATPHHGSPLATTVIGIREWLLRDVPGYWGYSLLALVGAADPLLPAVDDLAPNSGFLKELNQRKSGWRTYDWSGDCWVDFGGPNPEKGLVANTTYVTIRGDGWGGLFEVTGGFMAGVFHCGISDGVVPTESAYLYNSNGGKVFNYRLDDPVHHKGEIKGILEEPVVRDFVRSLLATDSGTWPASIEPKAGSVAKAATDWSFLGYRELMLPPAGSREDSITVDYCDTLAVDWSWFEGDVDLILESPSGAVIDSAFAALDPYVSLDLDRDAKWGRYLIEFPESGSWTLIAESANSTIEQNIVPLVSAAGSIRMSAAIEAVGEETFADRIIQVVLQSFTGLAVENADVSVVWTGPTGTTGTLALLDDGLPPDTAANDGVFSGQLGVEAVLGTTTLEIEAIGMEPEAFSRRNLLSIVTSQVFDLAVAAPGLSAVSTNGLALSPVELLATITNNGEGDAEVTVRFSTGNGLVLADSVMIVPAQGSLEVTADHLPLAEGLYEYELAVAPSGDYADADLANNTAVPALPIGPAVTGVPDVPGPGDETGEETPWRSGILAAYPNPFNPTVRIEFALEADGETRVRIFDLRGRLVRDLFSGKASAGRLALDWDGADGSGKRVATGAYLVHFQSEGDQDVRKIMLLK